MEGLAVIFRAVIFAIVLAAINANASTQDELIGAAYRVRGAAAVYQPPGWNQSLIWWKMNTDDGTNIVDYSAARTNNAVVTNALNGAAYINDGCLTVLSNGWAKSARTGIGITLTNCTYSCWFSVTAFKAYAGIFGLRVGTGYLTAIMNGSGTENAVASCYASSPFLSYISRNSTTNWINVVSVYTNSATGTNNNLTIYVNGSVAATYTTISKGAGAPPIGNGTWNAGTDNYDLMGRIFNGRIDDCYLTTYLFTAQDATNHYLQGRSP